MSYTIGTVVYGSAIKSTDRIYKQLERVYGEEPFTSPACAAAGFHWLYGSTYGYFGEILGEVDEADPVAITKIPKVTDDVRAKYAKRVDELPKKLQKLLKKPRWLILWSSS